MKTGMELTIFQRTVKRVFVLNEQLTTVSVKSDRQLQPTVVNGNTSNEEIFNAAKNGEIEILKNQLVFIKANYKSLVDQEGNTLLLIASQFGQLTVVQWLLENVAKPDEYNKNGKYALILAIQQASVDISPLVKWLVQQYKSKNILKQYDNEGRYPLHYAVRRRHLGLIEFLIKEGGSEFLNQYDNQGYYPLHYAVQEGNVQIVDFLIRAGANCNAQAGIGQGEGQETPLMLAIRYGHIRIAQYLFQLPKTDKNLKTYRCEDSLLHLAARYGRENMVTWLLETKKISIDAINYQSDTPLMVAITNGHIGVIEALLQQGASLDIQNKAKKKAWDLINEYADNEVRNKILLVSRIHLLWRAVIHDDVAYITKEGNFLAKILSHKFISERIKDKNQNNLLHSACRTKSKGVLKFLLEAYPQMLTEVNTKGESPLHLAVQCGEKEIVKLVVERLNTTEEVKWLNQKESTRGETALHQACRQKDPALLEILVDNFADSLAINHAKETPLHIAAAEGQVSMVQKLLKTSDVAARDALGRTPLAQAAFYGQKEVMFLLNRNNKDIYKLQDNAGNTLMHLAIQGDHDVMSELLLIDRIYFLQTANKEGLFPVHLAAKLGKKNFFEVFKANNMDLEQESGAGHLPIVYAILGSKLEVLKWLVDNTEIDLSKKDRWGKTLEDYARDSEDTRVQMILREARLQVPKHDRLEKIIKPSVKNLVFQGGGMKGLAYIGALTALEEKGLELNQIERVGGTSVGAITALFVGLGYKTREMHQLFYDGMDIQKFLDSEKIKAETLLNMKKIVNSPTWLERLLEFPRLMLTNSNSGSVGLTGYVSEFYKMLTEIHTTFGVYDGETFRKWLEEIIRKRLVMLKVHKENLTFSELHAIKEKHKNFGIKDIYVKGFNLSQKKVETFSWEDTPNVIIADAIRISMSLPFVYKPHYKYIQDNAGNRIKDSEDIFIDGGIAHNYPLNLFDDVGYKNDSKRVNKSDMNRETLGLRLISSEADTPAGLIVSENNKINTLFSFIWNISQALYNGQEHFYHQEDGKRSVFIDTMDISTVQFDLSRRDKELLFSKGKEAVEKYLKTHAYFQSGGYTPLQLIAEIGIRRGEKFDFCHPEDLFSLFCAVSDDEIAALKNLHLNLDVVDKQERTAMHLAVYHGRSACVERLLACGANPACRDKKGRYPIDIAVEKNRLFIVLIFLKRGAYKSANIEGLRQFLEAKEAQGDVLPEGTLKSFSEKTSLSIKPVSSLSINPTSSFFQRPVTENQQGEFIKEGNVRWMSRV